MKKSLFYIAAASLALVSCNEEELVNAPASQENRVLTATFEQDATTRMHIDADNRNALTWSEGDMIHVWDASGNASILTLQSGAGTASATFEVTDYLTDKIVAAAFHADASYNSSTSTLIMNNLTFSSTQKEEGVLTLPMWGEVDESGNIEFKHLAGLLKVNLSNVPQGYNKLVVETDKVIAGEFSADVSQENPVFIPLSNVESNKTVTVSFTNAAATTLYLPLPVGTYESIVVSVSGENGTNTKVLKQFSGITVERAKVYSTSADISTYVTTEAELRTAIAKEGVVNLGANITITEPLVISAAVTLNGNNFTIENTTPGENARAINVNCDGNVTIKNLTVVAAGQRAINVIQNPAKLTLDNVTATADNYALNVASSASTSATDAESAPAVTIRNSTLTGSNTVNITGDYVTVTIESSTINCVDNRTEATNAFGAISIFDASNVHVTVDEETTINVTEGSDSFEAQISADDTNTITFPANSTYEVLGVVAIIPSGNYAAGYTSLEAALSAAQSGKTVKLVKGVTLTSTITVAAEKNIILDLNSQTITISKEDDATEVTDFKNQGTITIKNGSIFAGNDEYTRRCIYNYGTMTIEGVNFTQSYGQKGAAINNEGTMTIQGETTVNSTYYSIWNSGSDANLTVYGGAFTCDNIDAVTNPCYCVNNLAGATLTVNDGTFTGDHGAIGLAGEGTTATLNKGTFTCTGVAGKSDHVIYVPTGTTLRYSENDCSFISEEPDGNDNGGQLIYNGGGTVEKI